MIEPTNGRVVWFRPSADDHRHMAVLSDQPLAAHIAFVHDARSVTLMVIDHAGRQHARDYVPLLQDDDERPADGHFAEWMPFQKGQAAKNEQLEQKLAASS